VKTRLVVLTLAIAAALAPIAAVAAPPARVIRIGLLDILAPKFDPAANPLDRALVESLQEYGYVIGRNVVLEFRSADGHPDRLPPLAAELVAAKVDMIITKVTAPTLAAKAATQTIPIIMLGAADPVLTGIVASLPRPGGNITGLAYNAAEISAKRVQLLQEAVPKLSRVGVLWNSSFKAMALGFQHIEQAAPALGATIQSIRVSGSSDFDQAFTAMTQTRPDGLIVLFGPMRGDDLPRIVEFVAKNRIPTVFELDRGVKGGGLMEFGPSFTRQARRVGGYVDKIANGARPADLPVEEPSEFEIVINLKAAKTLGLTIPQSLLLRADRVVE
jgi:putative ABC transport system substrate-binding protein